MSDILLPLNCPFCRLELTFLKVDGENYIYSCLMHGAIVVPPDGCLRAWRVTDERVQDGSGRPWPFKSGGFTR
jgi:hypothetical protein